MKVLVIGSGGREHAIAKQFNEAPSVEKVFVFQAIQKSYFSRRNFS